MSSPDSVVNPVCSLVMFEPLVSLFVLYPLQWELVLSQAVIAVCVPHASTQRPVAAGFANVWAEDPLHLLHRSEALDATPAPIPPATAVL